MEKFKAFFDGSSIPNPGDMTIGGYIETEVGSRVSAFHLPKGDGTNNRAEYLAIIHLLEEAVRLDIKDIEIFGDSLLVVNHVNGLWQSNKDMTPYKSKVLQLLRNFNSWTLTHIKREFNAEADSLTR